MGECVCVSVSVRVQVKFKDKQPPHFYVRGTCYNLLFALTIVVGGHVHSVNSI